MDRFCRFLSAVLLVAVLAACAGRGGDIPYDPPGFTAPDPLANKVPQLPTVLGPGDVIDVKVYRVADLSGEQVVDNTGRIRCR